MGMPVQWKPNGQRVFFPCRRSKPIENSVFESEKVCPIWSMPAEILIYEGIGALSSSERSCIREREGAPDVEHACQSAPSFTGLPRSYETPPPHRTTVGA